MVWNEIARPYKDANELQYYKTNVQDHVTYHKTVFQTQV